MRGLLEQTAEQAITYLESLDARGVAPTEDAIARLDAFDEPLPRSSPGWPRTNSFRCAIVDSPDVRAIRPESPGSHNLPKKDIAGDAPGDAWWTSLR